MNKIDSASHILKSEGPFRLFAKSLKYAFLSVHRHVYQYLPPIRPYGTYNGVELKGTDPPLAWPGKHNEIAIQHRILDHRVPWNTPSKITNYKQPNLRLIRQHYRKGDDVVIIGGGNGISSVETARQVGNSGRVTIYEGNEDRVHDLRRTLRHNGVCDNCTINHAVVGEGHLVENSKRAEQVEPTTLPECDVLEMDCEGAELEILQSLTIEPSLILVELHHEKDYSPYSSAKKIKDILQQRGYSVERHDGPWVDVVLLARAD